MEASTDSHVLGSGREEWTGAFVFLAVFLVTLLVWNTSIAWYLKPIVNLLLPIALGTTVQGYLMIRNSKY
jgi:hypothetical protein